MGKHSRGKASSFVMLFIFGGRKGKGGERRRKTPLFSRQFPFPFHLHILQHSSAYSLGHGLLLPLLSFPTKLHTHHIPLFPLPFSPSPNIYIRVASTAADRSLPFSPGYENKKYMETKYFPPFPAKIAIAAQHFPPVLCGKGGRGDCGGERGGEILAAMHLLPFPYPRYFCFF